MRSTARKQLSECRQWQQPPSRSNDQLVRHAQHVQPSVQHGAFTGGRSAEATRSVLVRRRQAESYTHHSGTYVTARSAPLNSGLKNKSTLDESFYPRLHNDRRFFRYTKFVISRGMSFAERRFVFTRARFFSAT